MPKTRAQKESDVQELTDKLTAAKSVVLANYQGMTMPQLLELRQKLALQSAEFTVTKNNLMKIAFKNAGYSDEADSALVEATATLMAFGDEITPIKTLTKAIKDNQIGSIKFGFLDKNPLSANEVAKLATLPSKDELRAKTVGTLAAPLYAMVNVLQANIRNLVYALDQVRISKGGE